MALNFSVNFPHFSLLSQKTSILLLSKLKLEKVEKKVAKREKMSLKKSEKVEKVVKEEAIVEEKEKERYQRGKNETKEVEEKPIQIVPTKSEVRIARA